MGMELKKQAIALEIPTTRISCAASTRLVPAKTLAIVQWEMIPRRGTTKRADASSFIISLNEWVLLSLGLKISNGGGLNEGNPGDMWPGHEQNLKELSTPKRLAWQENIPDLLTHNWEGLIRIPTRHEDHAPQHYDSAFCDGKQPQNLLNSGKIFSHASKHLFHVLFKLLQKFSEWYNDVKLDQYSQFLAIIIRRIAQHAKPNSASCKWHIHIFTSMQYEIVLNSNSTWCLMSSICWDSPWRVSTNSSAGNDKPSNGFNCVAIIVNATADVNAESTGAEMKFATKPIYIHTRIDFQLKW